MKRVVAILAALLLLTGCGGKNTDLERAMGLRAQMQAKSVTFDAEITADYGDQSYTFAMNCQADPQGELTFSVTAPETISGISGKISATGGKLTFEDTALAFDTMAEERITPASAPWVMLKALRSGYLTSCCVEDDLLRISVDDSYEDDALHLEVWLDEQNIPVRAEIYWDGRRLLTVNVSNFGIL